jgi:hypothetical protein
VRTSATSWCNVDSCLRDTRFQEIRQRISNLTRVPWENAEHLQARSRVRLRVRVRVRLRLRLRLRLRVCFVWLHP